MDPDNEAEVLEAPAEETSPEAPHEEAPTPQIPAETVTKARDMGWVPKEEWRGSPDAWRPADEYLKRGEEVLPIVKSRADRAERKVHELETRLADLPKSIREELDKDYADRFKRLEGMSRIALEKQRERLWNDFEGEKRKAVADGNTEEYDRLAKEQRQALADFHTEEEPEPAPQRQAVAAQPQSPPPAINDWVGRNIWFDTKERPGHKRATALAIATFGELQAQSPWAVEQNLAETEAEVKAKFPEVFGLEARSNGQRQPHAPSVEAGGRQTQSFGKSKGWNDLPQEARTSADKFIRQDGLFLPKGADADNLSEADIKKARDAYARDYWNQG